MLPSEEKKSGFVGDNPIKATLRDPENSMEQQIKLLNNSVKSLERKNSFMLAIIIGLSSIAGANATATVAANWSVIAPVLQTVGSAIAVALPGIGIAVGIAVAAVALGVALKFAYKHREQIKEGLEKGWGQVKELAGYTKDKTVEAYENSKDSLKRGASFVNEKTKEKASNKLLATAKKLYNAAGKENYGEKLDQFTSEEKEKSKEIREDLKGIFADEGNNTGLIKDILSKIASKIDSKIANKTYRDFRDYLPDKDMDKLQQQKNFINALSGKDLHRLLTERSLPKDKYLMNSIFSDHYNEINGIIKECKESHLLADTSNMFNTAEKKANRPSFNSIARSVSSFSSLGRKSSTQSTSSLPEGGSLSSLNSEAELLNLEKHKEVKPTTSLRSKVSSLFKGNKATKEETPEQKTIPYATIGARRSSNGPIPVAVPTVSGTNVAPPKPPRTSMPHSNSLGSLTSNASRGLSGSESANSFSFQNGEWNNPSSSSADSGMSSPGSSTSKRSSSMANLNREAMEKRNSLNETGHIKDGEFNRPSTSIEVTANSLQAVPGLSVR
jgi:hypothetical protein